MVLYTVRDFFEAKRETVEKYNEDRIVKLRWDCPDVLYSFRGIYTIGVFVYYRELFIDDVKTDIILKEKIDDVRQHLYSDKFLRVHYTEFGNVNELPEIQLFLQHYYDIGNIIPTWPGANVNRGMAHCYDIPNIYYRRYEKFTRLICEHVYKNMFIDKVLENNKYDTVADFLKFGKEEYTDFLEYIIGVIEERTNMLECILQQDKKHE